MTVVLPIERFSTAAMQAWRLHLTALGIVSAAILLLFRRDAADMVEIWLGTSTFNHCALILPIIGWLVWQRLPELRQLQPAAWAPGLAIVAAGALFWLLGEAAIAALPRHFGLVLMLQGAVVACLGKAVTRGLLFPLFYAFFLVPTGQEIEPMMQTLTAEMAMVMLALTGVPAHIEGVFISIPNGYFEVAEACSGVRFLIAMAALGVLVANVCFRSWTRRALFMLAAIVIPILANGLRAFATIYAASLTSPEAAAGLDHIVYGWVFFAFVVALTMGAGWRFFDRGIDEPWFDPKDLQPADARPGSSRGAVQVAAAALALAAAPAFWSSAIAASGAAAPTDIALPSVPGWQRMPSNEGRPWRPSFEGADVLRMGRYRDRAGQKVDLAIAVFSRQGEEREIVGYGQGPIALESAWAWTASGSPPPGGRLDRIASFGTVREVATFYRVGDKLTGSEVEVKLETMKVRLLGGSQRAVAVLVSAEAPGEGESGRPALDAFLAALGPIEMLADRAASPASSIPAFLSRSTLPGSARWPTCKRIAAPTAVTCGSRPASGSATAASRSSTSKAAPSRC
jgi:exosortase A